MCRSWAILIIGLLLSVACHYRAVVVTNIPMQDTAVATSSFFISYVKPYHDSVEKKMRDTVAYSDAPLSKGFPCNPLGYYVAQWIYNFVLRNTSDTPDLVILNNGGLRKALPGGYITVGDIYELMPFDNRITYLEISRENFKELLEYMKQKQSGAVYGLTIEYRNNEPVLVNGSESLKEMYRIVTSDYLANGGDYITFFSNPVVRKDFPYLLRDAIIEELREMHKNNIIITPKYLQNVIFPEP